VDDVLLLFSQANRLECLSMMHEAFTHEVGDDPMPRRRVRTSGPVYDDYSVPLMRVEYEDGSCELVPRTDLRIFRALHVLSFDGTKHLTTRGTRSRRLLRQA
jgi:hypothetical protein